MKKLLPLIAIIVITFALWQFWPNKTQTITVFFLNTANFNIGREPYEKAVVRKVTASDPMKAVLEELVKGPTVAEKEDGLEVIKSEATDLRLDFDPETSTANVYLIGGCNSRGSTYSISNLIDKNLRQFPEVKYVRIYDPVGKTLGTEGATSDSLPTCLQP
ncbi:MAG: hypothetical protein A2571_00015 [Candidatus Vogelbacteria bacterium RIFOXYD1_FULL_44_32]|uniref:GerMN domain-containing protein n=1 Tax=Candidatus Vogelbacteria bacterium RIFOXYD1_FULL_44_32 TaxID=1802438 RepID=A0A1G2QFH8_9BACT|nr:MAG: hypothetical protein A2571_00015 [Candidatus Vogelbacteria bacterium RIFOXYD1_FULL_44_32]